MPDTVTADADDLTVGAKNNPDGFGWAIHDRTRVLRGHGMDFAKVLDEFLAARRVHNGPALFHSRITTHGSTSKANCHPFQIGNDRLSVLAHNGMLPIKDDGKRSDTRIFAEDILPANGGVSLLNSRKRRKELAEFAKGSKLVILSANPASKEDYYIINEDDGDWSSDGVWWSNNSYRWSRYTSLGSGMYSSGWQPAHSTSVIVSTKADDVADEVEYWECLVCSAITKVDLNDPEIDQYCETCWSCWYCAEHATYCRCWDNADDGKYCSYDSDVDVNENPNLSLF